MRSATGRVALALLLAGAAAGLAPAVAGETPPPVPPGDTSPEVRKLRLTLDEAVGRALRTSERLAAARSGLELARAGVGEALAGALPTLSADGSLSRAKHEITEAEKAAAMLPGGPEPEKYGTVWTAGLQVSQTLFAGGAVWNSWTAARWLREASAQDLLSVRQATAYAAAQAYYSAVLARETEAVRRATLDLATRHYEDMQAREKAGTASRFDVLRAKVSMQNQKAEVILSGNARRSADMVLRRQLGMSQPAELELVTGFASPEAEPEEAAALQAAAGRPDLAAATLAVRAGESGVRAARAGYYPRVSAVASWGGQSTDDPFAGDNFDEAGSVGLQLQWALFDGMLTRSRAAAARADLERRRWLARALERDAALEVQQALLGIRNARELIASEGANVEEAGEALRLAGARLAAGAGTQLEVLDARTALEQARLGHARALYLYSVGGLDLRRATGTIIGEDAP